MGVRRVYIRELVERILDEHMVERGYVDVEQLATKYGACIVREPADDDLSGFLLRDHANGTSIIGVNKNHSRNRQHFTVAHEFGHLLLHEGERVHMDRAGYGLRFRRRPDEPEEKPSNDEQEANLFAAELLMPKRFIDADMADLTADDILTDDFDTVLRSLAEKYQVSVQALTFRLAYLNYLVL